MPDETPASPPPAVSPLQVVSATIQNLFVGCVISYAWLISGKLDATVALPSLFAILGIDFMNRFRLPIARTAALVLILGSAALGLSACAKPVDLQPIRTALDMSREAYTSLCVPMPESPAAIERCHVARLALDVGIAAYNEVENHAADAGAK